MNCHNTLTNTFLLMKCVSLLIGHHSWESSFQSPDMLQCFSYRDQCCSDTLFNCHGGNLAESATAKAIMKDIYCAGRMGGDCASVCEFALKQSEILEIQC